MDFRLKEFLDRAILYPNHAVSILVLMDFRLKVGIPSRLCFDAIGFNPCSNGLSAQRRF